MARKRDSARKERKKEKEERIAKFKAKAKAIDKAGTHHCQADQIGQSSDTTDQPSTPPGQTQHDFTTVREYTNFF